MKALAISLFLVTFFATSCAHRLVGTWNVEKYETSTNQDQGSAISLSNIGTMTFTEDFKGQKEISLSILGMKKSDNMPFEWSADDKSVSIKSENSVFSKTWLIIKSKKNYQKWQATDGANEIQVLELRKKE